MKQPLLFTMTLALLLLTVPVRSRAHPHVWVTMETEIEFNAKKEITGFKHHWTFDEFYAEFAVTGLAKTGDGSISSKDLDPLAKTNVEALKEFGYFTFAAAGQEKVEVKEPADYRLEYKDKLLTLHFTLPLAKPVPSAETGAFSFQIYDPGYYVALTFAKKKPVTLSAGAPTGCRPQVGDGRSDTEIPLAQAAAAADPTSVAGAQLAEKVSLVCTSR